LGFDDAWSMPKYLDPIEVKYRKEFCYDAKVQHEMVTGMKTKKIIWKMFFINLL